MSEHTIKTLSIKELNRTYLKRQLLINRSSLAALEVIEHLCGMQNQEPFSPYTSLLARIENFKTEDLSSLLLSKEVTRATLMRGTIHLVSKDDFFYIQPLLYDQLRKIAKNYLEDKSSFDDIAQIGTKTVKLLSKEHLTLGDLGRKLQKTFPNHSVHDLGSLGRAETPLVQVTPRGVWGRVSPAQYAVATQWLNGTLNTGNVERLVLRYLAAYGPASVSDMRAWSGLGDLRSTFKILENKLIKYKNTKGQIVFDIPEGKIVDSEEEVPVRFLGEFDNALLSHNNRSRIIADDVRKIITSRNGMVPGTLLVNGFVEAIWRYDKKKATLVVRYFRKLTKTEMSEILVEAEHVLKLYGGTAGNIEFLDINS